MNPHEFDYACMWRYYRSAGTPTVDSADKDIAFAHHYRADYSALKKYDKDGDVRPFIFKKMQVAILKDSDPLSGPHGTYVVVDGAPLTGCLQAKKNLYVVTPVLHDNGSDRILACDHFSFSANKGVVERKQLQFHRTEYVPISATKLQTGNIRRIPSFMPLKFQLPANEAAFLKTGYIDSLSDHSSTLFELFTRPWSAFGNGGGRQDTRRRRLRRMPPSEGDFDHIWTRLPIYSLLVLGVPSTVSGHWDVTMVVTDRYKDERFMEAAYLFRVRSTDDLRVEIGKRFEGQIWDDYTPVPRDSLVYE
jgi:hypothetical protein